MTRTDSIPFEDTVLAMKQANPELSAAELASRLGCSTERVETALREHDRIDLEANVLEPDTAAWDDPTQCPFCGVSIDDGGPGFIEHVEAAGECAVAFSRWREGISGDVAGEWIA